MRRTNAELGDFQTADNVALGVRNRFAVFAGKSFCQLVHVAVEKIYELHHHASATLRVGGSPGRLCGSSIGNCRVHLGLAGQGDLRLDFTGCRVVDVCKAAGGSLHVLAADKMTDLPHVAFLPICPDTSQKDFGRASEMMSF